MGKKILLIEDDKKLSRYIELELQHEGYETTPCFDGKSGLEEAISDKYDLVVLDIMLPEMNGMEVCRKLRQHSDVPVVMLTARGDTLDKVAGLDVGADDYISKPFEIDEFLARVRRFFRSRHESVSEVSCEKLKLNTDNYTCSYNDESIALSKTEYDLCLYLVKNQGRVLTREQILENVWGYDFYGETRVVDVYIRYLREKIDDKYNVQLINTVRGVGYILKSEG